MTALATSAGADVTDDLRDGDRYFEENEWKKAAAAYDAAIRSAPGQVAPEAYGKRVAIFIIQKDYRGGLEFVRKVAKAAHPDAPEVLEQEALLLWATNDKPGAVAVAEKAVAKKPSLFSNQSLICEFHAGKDTPKTIAACEAYLSSRPSERESRDVLPRLRLGNAYLDRGRRALRVGKPVDANADYGRAASQFETVARKLSKEAYAQPNADIGLCAAYTGQSKFDQAIAVCERLHSNPKHVDSNASVHYNLGAAYLAKKLPQRARTAANDYLRVRKNEPRGHILIGDAYFQEKEWAQALNAYLQAEKMLRGSGNADLSVKLGKTYRRMPAAGSGNTNLTLAIEKLEAGAKAQPGDLDLGIELGGAYLAARKDDRALATADRLIASKEFASAPADKAADLYLVSGKAQYNQGKLVVARQRFEAAVQLKPKDVQVRRGLVETINAQAWNAYQNKDARGAASFLAEAGRVDERSPMTALNLGVLALDKGDCDAAVAHLERLSGQRGYTMIYERLAGRAQLCAKRPNKARAAEHFARADEEAAKNQANLMKAEIYTEWAPLLLDSKLDEAVEKLDIAVRFAAQTPEVVTAAKRNLAVALFRRGWRNIKAGKDADAVADLERATREPALLKGTEPSAFEFSYALALLEKGDNAEAGKIFKALAAKGNQGAYLRSPYNTVGSQFFGAYTDYRTNNATSRQKAATDFTKISGGATGAFAAKVRDLIASSWEYVAYDHWRGGRTGPASKALENAERYANDDIKRRISNNRAALDLDRGKIGMLDGLRGSPPEALVNLGIVYDQAGRPKDAYDAWRQAASKGVQAKDLQKWIDAKKRIYGY
jgi:lipopolysaccharide biosynthesis regulator YciM